MSDDSGTMDPIEPNESNVVKSASKIPAAALDALKREKDRQSGIKDLGLPANTSYLNVLSEKLALDPKNIDLQVDRQNEMHRVNGIAALKLPEFSSNIDVLVEQTKIYLKETEGTAPSSSYIPARPTSKGFIRE
jgi:hypothetical protein